MSTTDPAPPWHVRMGQFAVGRPPQVLKATLGSCVGIAVLWPARDLYALAHCLLPRAPHMPCGAGARYVDQAFHTLLKELAIGPEHLPGIAFHLAGGADMSRLTTRPPGAVQIGKLNIEAAHDTMRQLGLQAASLDLGGVEARKMTLDCTTGHLTVERVPGLKHTAQPAEHPVFGTDADADRPNRVAGDSHVAQDDDPPLTS
jgi:chemotaxis protein CheD